MTRAALALVTALLLLAIALSAHSQGKYDPGVSDSEIKLGQTAPYSGPVSAYGTFGRASVAYFAMINEAGGINGRKINLLTADDGFSPPKTVEQTRKLVESDGVFAMFAPVGTSPNAGQRTANASNPAPRPHPAPRGRWVDRAFIRRLYADGLTLNEIADQLNLRRFGCLDGKDDAVRCHLRRSEKRECPDRSRRFHLEHFGREFQIGWIVIHHQDCCGGIHAATSSGDRGKTTVKVLPLPGSLSTEMPPPVWRTIP
jgi:hypothetical protein